jgi:hypothetical protein
MTNTNQSRPAPSDNYQYIVRAAAMPRCDEIQLKQWLECKDFILCAKAHSIGVLPVNADSLRHFKAVAQCAFSVPHYENEKIVSEIAPSIAFVFKASNAMADAAAKVEEKIEPALEQLQVTPLGNKRDVLRHMQIIPTTVAAAYLGVSERSLHAWKKKEAVFGVEYAGSHCYSLEELKMIGNNRFWIYDSNFEEIRITASDDDKSMDEVVMVDYDVAAAFTDLTYDELHKHLPRNQPYKRPYRLSDLEKIRVAKLNGLQQ